MRPMEMGFILCVMSCLLISINLLVGIVLLRILLKKSSQSWCFVLNLALADALVGIAATGLATEDFNNNMNQSLHCDRLTDPGLNATPAAPGKARCLMRMAFVMSSSTASILSMFLISLDRYAAIKMPLRYSQLSGKATAGGALFVLWSCSFLLGFSPVMVRQLQTVGYNGVCAFFSVIYPAGIIIVFSVCFFPVLSIFVCIYLDILKIACIHQRQIFRIRQAGSRTSESTDPRSCQQQDGRRYWSHVKALRTVAMLVGCFLLLWCPFFVVCIVQLLCKSCKLINLLENHLWLLGLCNSLINPLVYAYRQKEVRMELAAMFCCASAPRVRARGDTQQPRQDAVTTTNQQVVSNKDPRRLAVTIGL